ncbi:MAG: NAD(P)H-hydrate dehydratase, partial [Rhodobacterales bacterium]|nr:NAD(P)H-hydrate dehydratase [Rhodobacterales bacterium]
DSGRVLGRASQFALYNSIPLCRLTVTFDSPKTGHFLADGPESCGKLHVVDIGLEKWRETKSGLVEGSRALRLASLSLVLRDPLVMDTRPSMSGVRPVGKCEGHKYSHGHALILSGGPAQTGAARLAARGAIRIGAGVVTLGVPPSAQMECAMHLTAIMIKRIADADALSESLKDQRINALCLGPALGLNERSRALIEVALNSNAAVVLDADALSLYADDPETLFSLTAESRCVLTPHAGEFARLFPDISAKLNTPATIGPAYSKVDATRDAAKRAGCVVLFKGPDTVIADPTGRCSINSAQYDRAAPWLATAGSGDVLAGFITGLLARGFDPMMASETAAWLHVECARSFGPALIAEDLPEQLPKVFREQGV